MTKKRPKSSVWFVGSIFKKYRCSWVFEVVHVQQPKPKVENVSRVQLVQFYTQIGFGLKWNEDRQFGETFIPLAQTSAAHCFRVYHFLKHLELIWSLAPGFPAHICMTET